MPSLSGHATLSSNRFRCHATIIDVLPLFDIYFIYLSPCRPALDISLTFISLIRDDISRDAAVCHLLRRCHYFASRCCAAAPDAADATLYSHMPLSDYYYACFSLIAYFDAAAL